MRKLHVQYALHKFGSQLIGKNSFSSRSRGDAKTVNYMANKPARSGGRSRKRGKKQTKKK